MNELKRCSWCGEDEIYQAYHDEVWGVPTRNRQQLFKMLCLEGMQAGLSWYTVLIREQAFETAFLGWEIEAIAQFDEAKVMALLNDRKIIRNRRKIQAVITNAHQVLQLEAEGIDFVEWLWSFVGATPQINSWQKQQDVPSITQESLAMSKALRKRGFSFVGPTICYAFMQATGMVNDHLINCPKHPTNKLLDSAIL